MTDVSNADVEFVSKKNIVVDGVGVTVGLTVETDSNENGKDVSEIKGEDVGRTDSVMILAVFGVTRTTLVVLELSSEITTGV